MLRLYGRWREQGPIHGSTLLVDYLNVLDEPLQGLSLPDVRAYRGQLVPAVEAAAQGGGLLAQSLGQAGDLGVEIGIVGLDRLGVGHGPQRQVGLHRVDGAGPQLGHELVLRLPHRLQVLLEVGALRLQPVDDVVEATLHLAPDERVRHLLLDELRDRIDHLLAQRQLRLHLLHRRHAGADVAAQLLDRVELRRPRPPSRR